MALRIGGHSIGLDRKDPQANLNFVSHAHSDHTSAVKKGARILCSSVTRELVEVRSKYGINAVEKPECVSLLNSGHMLGSRQLYIESEEYGCSVIYTGDYQLQESSTSEPIEIRHADVLMVDSTYPFANVAFDERDEVITAMQHYIRYKERMGCVIFGAYSMGKAQEIISICNDVGIEPVVDRNTARMTEVYNRNGFGLRFVEAEDMANHFDSPVEIVSMGKLYETKMLASEAGKTAFTAVATGFARFQKFRADVQFTLSDHADFKQTLDYVEQCGPKSIFTYGPNADILAKNLRAYGHDAREFDVRSDLGKMMALEI